MLLFPAQQYSGLIVTFSNHSWLQRQYQGGAISTQELRFCDSLSSELITTSKLLVMVLCCLQELSRRCDTLIRLVEKENDEMDAAEREEKKKTTKAASKATESSGAPSRKRKASTGGAPAASKRRSVAA